MAEAGDQALVEAAHVLDIFLLFFSCLLLGRATKEINTQKEISLVKISNEKCRLLDKIHKISKIKFTYEKTEGACTDPMVFMLQSLKTKFNNIISKGQH